MAVINRVTPAAGSTLGGTHLTISGAGFPNLDSINSGGTDTLAVSAAGVPCQVEAASYSSIVCRTAAQPADWQAVPVATGGAYPGGRGVEVLQWPDPAVNATFGWGGSLKVLMPTCLSPSVPACGTTLVVCMPVRIAASHVHSIMQHRLTITRHVTRQAGHGPAVLMQAAAWHSRFQLIT